MGSSVERRRAQRLLLPSYISPGIELLCPLLFGFGLPLDAHSWARKADRICNDSSSYSNEMLLLPSNVVLPTPPYSLLPLLESRKS